MSDKFPLEQSDKKLGKLRGELLKSGLTFDPKRYVFNEHWVPAKDPLEAHSTLELVKFLEKDEKLQIDARILGFGPRGRSIIKLNRKGFIEAAKKRDSKKFREGIRQFRESYDSFAYDSEASSAGVVGSPDFVPLLGGPFNKQLYLRDYLRMISASYYASNHDPAAKAVTNIMVAFTMGRGFQVQSKGPEAAAGQVLWNAFSEANEFHEQMDHFADELSRYGECMWWWLPENKARISFQPRPGEGVPTGLIPRIRLLDPSNFVEIITIPEDIAQGVLAYVWLAPTQSQMYTTQNQPSTKFIYTQIPAEQIFHVKVNVVSNEKRGRSDLFPCLGYMKRLRDGVNYSLVAQQKAAAWCIDTTIEGDEADMDAYLTQQRQYEEQNGEQAAGSEFVHSKAVTRNYLSNQATSRAGESPVFNWCLNMIAMASGIPVGYLGTHLQGGSTRAAALVATEPVAKLFERRQMVYERTVRKIYAKLMKTFGINSTCDVIFPELITQDRSAMLKDLSLAQANEWISPRRAAELVAQELDIDNFNYETELEEIKKAQNDGSLVINPDAVQAPLTAPPAAPENPDKGSALTSDQKSAIKANERTM